MPPHWRVNWYDREDEVDWLPCELQWDPLPEARQKYLGDLAASRAIDFLMTEILPPSLRRLLSGLRGCGPGL